MTATATTPVRFVRIDSQLLDVFLTWEQQVAGLEVTEYPSAGDGDNEWLIRLLQTKAFPRLPEAHIAALLQALTPHTARAGEVIIQQGAKGDFFFIVQSGTVRVTRQASALSAAVTFADLTAGDSFGEEALLSDQPRNASVTGQREPAAISAAREGGGVDTEPEVRRLLRHRPAQCRGRVSARATRVRCACVDRRFARGDGPTR